MVTKSQEQLMVDHVSGRCVCSFETECPYAAWLVYGAPYRESLSMKILDETGVKPSDYDPPDSTPGITVDELIDLLRELSAQGHGSKFVRHPDTDYGPTFIDPRGVQVVDYTNVLPLEDEAPVFVGIGYYI